MKFFVPMGASDIPSSIQARSNNSHFARRLPLWVLGVCIVGLLSILTDGAFAQEFRTLRPILTPQIEELPPEVSDQVDGKYIPVDRRELDKTVRELMAKWNTPEFKDVLADTFFDKARVEDTMRTNVLRHARLRVLSVQGVQILNQQVIPDPSGLPMETVVSTISATVRAQAEFNDPNTGFQRQEGVNELLLQVTQQVLR